MVRVFNWNVRGLNDPNKRCLVKSVVPKYKGSVLCLQESKVEAISRSFLRSFTGSCFDKCQFVKSDGASGGIITCWSSTTFSCGEVIVRNFSLSVRLKHIPSGVEFFVTNVYGPPSWTGKEDFCRELLALKADCGGVWVKCGDFNMTKNLQEKRGRSWSGRLMDLFSGMVNELEMIDLPMSNQMYTWSNMQSNPSLAKLDRFLISTEWDQRFPLSKVVAVPRITSDHTPICCPLVRTSNPLSSDLRRFGLRKTNSVRRCRFGRTRSRRGGQAPSRLLLN